ncbi:MAG: hypothetical protein ACJA2X_001370 [Halocynthiibacter sp.]|jgi:hypothetical protein
MAQQMCFQELPSASHLHALLSTHALEAAVLFSHTLHLDDQRRAHAAKLRAPFVEACVAPP